MVEELAAWHNDATGFDEMIVFVRRNPSSGSCEVEIRTHERSKLQELLSEPNAFALAAQIRKAARGRWRRLDVTAPA